MLLPPHAPGKTVNAPKKLPQIPGISAPPPGRQEGEQPPVPKSGYTVTPGLWAHPTPQILPQDGPVASYDIAIIGSGFGGALLAMVARKLGRSVILLEKGKHPRFAIGESTSPLMNLLIEQLAHRYDLPHLIPLTSYGAWQRAYPQIVCGLKRGFTYFYHNEGKPFTPCTDRSNQLMVAASPNDEVADTHWLRSDVDAFLVREAISLGVNYQDETTLTSTLFTGEGAFLEGWSHGNPLRVRARLVVDATGPNGFLARTLHLPSSPFADYPPTQTLYSHFTGVRRCEQMPEFAPDRWKDSPPYPMDDAALHHLFDGGWMWVLRFNNGVTSAGIAVEDRVAEELRLSEGEPAWHRFLAKYPSIAAQFENAVPTRPFTFAPRLSYRAERVTDGRSWLLLPSATAFVDPLFSTGMPLTLLGIERLGRILEEAWDTPHLSARLREYEQITLAEADTTARFIGGCYATLRDGRFPLFASYSMFYFAAASYSEMARRLGKQHLVGRFLAGDRYEFAPYLLSYAQTLNSLDCIPTHQPLPSDPVQFAHQVAAAIEPLNVAGLADPEKRNWYGVDLHDVVLNASKLEMTSDEMKATLPKIIPITSLDVHA